LGSIVGCGRGGRNPDTPFQGGEPVTLSCAARFSENISGCSHAVTDYEPRRSPPSHDQWAACPSDSYYTNKVFPLVVGPSAPGGGIGRLNAFEDMGTKLWRNATVPTKQNFTDALVIYGMGDGSISSRAVRRQDIHYPDIPNNSKSRCTEPGVADAYPDRCVGPAKIVPILNRAFEAAIQNGTEPLSQSARIEAALIWFSYVSVLAEQGTCRDTPEDCDSVWSHYNAALAVDNSSQKGLGRYFKDLSDETHFRVFDGVLAINCWRHLDPAPLATNPTLYQWSLQQIDTAMLRGLALILRERFSNLAACSIGDVKKAHLAFVNILGPFMDRAARAKNAAQADILLAQATATDPSRVDVPRALAAIDALFPCP
jgi:hypothetical protein